MSIDGQMVTKMAMRFETKAERRLRETMIHNTRQRLARIVDKLNDIDDMKSAKYKRVHREMMKAAEQVAGAFTARISDGALRYFNGEEAVQERAEAAMKQGLGKIVPFSSCPRRAVDDGATAVPAEALCATSAVTP